VGLAVLLVIVGISQIYESWIGHFLVAMLGLMLMIFALVTGAMLRGRIKRTQANLFLLHKRIGVIFSAFIMGTFLYGLWINIQHEEALLTSVHGRLGLILILIVIIQLVSSLMVMNRSKIRTYHKFFGYSLAPLLFLEASWGLYNGVVAGPKSLVLLHSISGGLAALALVWIITEILFLKEGGIVRARIASYFAAFLVVAGCWIVGGYNYLTAYGSHVKPVILAGPDPWAHSVVMETKEHIFVFLPLIILALALTLAVPDREVLRGNIVFRRAVAITASLAFLMVLFMFLMGAIISNAGKLGTGGLI
jgi:hypothetical protein